MAKLRRGAVECSENEGRTYFFILSQISDWPFRDAIYSQT
jgi:hypothetical protein